MFTTLIKTRIMWTDEFEVCHKGRVTTCVWAILPGVPQQDLRICDTPSRASMQVFPRRVHWCDRELPRRTYGVKSLEDAEKGTKFSCHFVVNVDINFNLNSLGGNRR